MNEMFFYYINEDSPSQFLYTEKNENEAIFRPTKLASVALALVGEGPQEMWAWDADNCEFFPAMATHVMVKNGKDIEKYAL